MLQTNLVQLNPLSLALRLSFRLACTLALLIVGIIVVFAHPQAAHAQTAACDAAQGLPPNITVDTDLSGEVYVKERVRIVNGATLTLAAGTQVIFCAEEDLLVGDLFDAGAIVSNGTAANPVTFRPAEPDGQWGRVFFNFEFATGTTATTRMQHTVFLNGGGNEPGEQSAVLEFTSRRESAPATFDQITIRGSRSSGIFIRTESPNPPILSNLTITGSARVPIITYASTAWAITGTNQLTGNARDVIEVGSGVVLGGTIEYSQTWRNHNVPYQFFDDFGALRVRNNATLTLEPGVELRFPPALGVIVEPGAALIAEGTPTQRIRFEASDPDAAADPTKKWGTLSLSNGSVNAPTRIRYADFRNGGAPRNDPRNHEATIELYAPNGTTRPNTLIDHVSIRDSASSGMFVRVNENDSTPPSFSNLTITGSARVPIIFYASAVRGLGGVNALTGNARDVIEAWTGTVLGGGLNYTQTWQPHGVPYQLIEDLGGLRIRENATLRIAAGTTLLVARDLPIIVERGSLHTLGTATNPITITRSENDGAWGGIRLEDGNQQSRFEYTRILFGGNAGDDATVLVRGGTLSLVHTSIRNSTVAAIRSFAPFISVQDSDLQLNTIGIVFERLAAGQIRRSTIANNREVGIVTHPNSQICIDAIGNFWGTADGPADANAEADTCGSTATNDGSGNPVGAGVRYAPFLTSSDGGVADNSRIQAQDLWVIGDGTSSTTITVRLRDLNGQPLAGKMIRLETTRGTLTQPTSPTNALGETTATIRSTALGEAIITGYNVSDDRPLAAVSAVVFWRGQGTFGGLIDPNGAPFDAPTLILEGRPFQAGRPIRFRVPMQNTNATPISVTVSYAETRLNIGGEFRPVDVVSKVLQPGERWDAPGGYTPLLTGHSCVQAQIDFSDVTGAQFSLMQRSGGRLQKNRDNKPPNDGCKKPPKLNKNLFSFNRQKRAKAIAKSFRDINECVDSGVRFQHTTNLAQAGDDFTVITTPPTFTPIRFEADAELVPTQAAALNEVAVAAARMGELGEAIRITAQRLEGASQAEDVVAAGRQLDAYRAFKRQHAQAHLTLADALEALLQVYQQEGVPDSVTTREEYLAYGEALRTGGYPADVVAQWRAAGLDDALIEGLRQAELAVFAADEFVPASFYAELRTEIAELREAAAELQDRYALPTRTLAQAGSASYRIEPVTSRFVVGNPTNRRATVRLVVRPANLPINWSATLDQPSVTLDAGATTEMVLTLSPGSVPVLEDAPVQVAVEGYIGEELIGGIVVQQIIPAVSPASTTETVYLPLVVRQ